MRRERVGRFEGDEMQQRQPLSCLPNFARVCSASIAMICLICASPVRGVSFEYKTFGAGADGDGIGILGAFAGSADPANSFLRWQQANITYSFTANFTNAYGAAG